MYREASIFYFNGPFFWYSLWKISKPTASLPPLSSKISLRDTSFDISFNYLGFLSLQNAYWIFSDLFIPICVRKTFQFAALTFLENAFNLFIFTHDPVPHSKLLVEFFEKFCWRKLWFALSRFNQKIWRWLGTLVYLHFVWFVIFLNVMALQFCK